MITNTVLKIVLDTNMFISGFLFHGMIKAVFDLVIENKLRMYTSPKLKAEIIKKFKAFNVSKQEQNEVLQFIGFKKPEMGRHTNCETRNIFAHFTKDKTTIASISSGFYQD